MKKLKLIKVTKPKVGAYIWDGVGVEADYACSECGYGIAEEYKCCPYCGAEIDWGKIIW